MNFAIIVAAGKGTRMNSTMNKVFLEINTKPILCHTIKKFNDCALIDKIVIVAQKKDFEKINKINTKNKFSKVKKIVEGGLERQDSVYNGLTSINGKENDIVAIHNGSNPLVEEMEIIECIEAATKHGASVCAYPAKDTIKKIKEGFVESTIDRSNIYQMQTPQCIKYGILKAAFENAIKKNLKVTDDVMLIEAIGEKVKMVECSYKNIKITTQDDLEIAKGIMGKSTLIGIGQDSHKFVKYKKKKLMLGGLEINHFGFDANSDGDVILHSLFNAISSAIGGRSLGITVDKMCKEGITDSKEYLKFILKEMKGKGFCINNISISVEAGKPKLEPYSDKIKESLASILKMDREKIGLTFTSGEDLTSFGKGLGMQCFCIVNLR